MPTTVEVVHYYFNEAIVFCGYPIESKNRTRHTSKIIIKVTCYKCIKMLESMHAGTIPRWKKRPIFRRLHIKWRTVENESKFLSQCGIEVDKDNLLHTHLKICRVCKRNEKSRL